MTNTQVLGSALADNSDGSNINDAPRPCSKRPGVGAGPPGRSASRRTPCRDVENADCGQQSRRDVVGMPWTFGGRYEVGADQSVGGHAADRKAAGQQPEGGHARPEQQTVEGRLETRRGHRGGFRRSRCAVGGSPLSLRVISHEHRDERHHGKGAAATISEAQRQPCRVDTSATTGRRSAAQSRWRR